MNDAIQMSADILITTFPLLRRRADDDFHSDIDF